MRDHDNIHRHGDPVPVNLELLIHPAAYAIASDGPFGNLAADHHCRPGQRLVVPGQLLDSEQAGPSSGAMIHGRPDTAQTPKAKVSG